MSFYIYKGKHININNTHIIQGSNINLIIIDVVLLKLNCCLKGDFSAGSFLFSMFILPYVLGPLKLSALFLYFANAQNDTLNFEGHCSPYRLRLPTGSRSPKPRVASFSSLNWGRDSIVTQGLSY